MIAKSLRLKANQVKYVLLKGKKAGNNYLIFKFLPRILRPLKSALNKEKKNNEISLKCRFAVIVSTKINLKATVRNHLRRQIYEIIRLNQSIFKKPFDIIIIAKPEIGKLSYPAIEKELIHCLKKYIFHEQK